MSIYPITGLSVKCLHFTVALWTGLCALIASRNPEEGSWRDGAGLLGRGRDGPPTLRFVNAVNAETLFSYKFPFLYFFKDLPIFVFTLFTNPCNH